MALVGPISRQIWDMKYRLRSPSGEAIDKTIEDTWRRIATALAAPERDPGPWAERFYAAMTDFKFLPAGRVVAGAGSRAAGSATIFRPCGRVAPRSKASAPMRLGRSLSWTCGTRCAARS